MNQLEKNNRLRFIEILIVYCTLLFNNYFKIFKWGETERKILKCTQTKQNLIKLGGTEKN